MHAETESVTQPRMTCPNPVVEYGSTYRLQSRGQVVLGNASLSSFQARPCTRTGSHSRIKNHDRGVHFGFRNAIVYAEAALDIVGFSIPFVDFLHVGY